ncbi:MAG TPA: glycosyltransferase family 4 protein [Rhodopila sp.]|nr:glycosyltransferase family 4 protein [Rhodopila sp.]
MKILVHDYAGHPFQIHLSQTLAARGHHVTHLYFSEDPGPKAAFARGTDTRTSLRVEAIAVGHGYDKTSLVQRRFKDREYGRRVADFIQSLAPDVVISGNTPTEAQSLIIRRCKSMGIRFVYWLQDFYSIAATVLLQRRIGVLGLPVGWYYQLLERRQLRDSHAVVAITDDFVQRAATWSGNREKVVVIENWAAVGDIRPRPKANPWSRAHALDGYLNFVYAGTLGAKHKPELLAQLAAKNWPGTRIVVVAEGIGVRHLTEARSARALPQLTLLPLQPAEALPDVLGTSDVLVAMIDRDSGRFAVPSKVQSYLCAGRPILLAAPRENLAARTVIRANAGIVVDPDDTEGFLAAAAELRADPHLREQLGANGRAYAERVFDVERITDAFEQVLSGEREPACNARSRDRPEPLARGKAAVAATLR